jgi:DNA (cytosine-5)-methyltransferase 1
VWENVPGVLSSNGGKDFGTFLGALGELGYGFAYRVLDAQHFGVAQRRRRVFVVGYLGDWRVAAAVLFERESLQGNTKPSRKKREEVTANAEGSVGEAGNVSCVGGNLSPTVTSKWMKGYGGPSGSNETGNMVYATTIIDQSEGKWVSPNGEETIGTIMARDYKGLGNQDLEDGRGLAIRPHAVAQPIAVDTYNQTINEHTSQTIGSSASDVNHYGGVLQPIAVDVYNQSIDGQTSATITEAVGGTNTSGPKVMHSMDFKKSFYEIKKDVLVRKYPVDTDSLKRCLKKHKKISNNKISELLNLPKTKIEHWFRQDDSFAIPSAEHWFQLKEILHIETNIFDQSITEFIIEENKYDSTNRIYDSTFPSPTLTASNSGSDNYITPMAIRRLTPKECERLQGFPDDWTKIPYRNKEADQCPDGPRYKACGNSMAVPVMRWIGERINLIESML